MHRWLLALWLAGLLCVLLWAASARLQPGAVALTLVAVLGAGLAVRVSWKNLPCGQLAWDADTWNWTSTGCQAGSALNELSVIADLQSRLLLRFENQAGKGLWLWAASRRLPQGTMGALDGMDGTDVMDVQASSFSPTLPTVMGGVHAARDRP